MPEAVPAAERLSRFLNAAERLKDALEVLYNRQFSGVGEAVRYGRDQGQEVVRRNVRTLEVLVELRNVIQHSNYRNGEPLAIPRQDAVDAFEAITRLIEDPPEVRDFMVKNPATLAPDATLEEAAHLINERNVSQLPVCDQTGYVGLLTTNAIARWLAAVMTEGDVLEEDVLISDVLAHAEGHEVAGFVKPTTRAAKACRRLTAKNAPVALLVTATGEPSAKILGILNRFDVPDLMLALTVQLGDDPD